MRIGTGGTPHRQGSARDGIDRQRRGQFPRKEARAIPRPAELQRREARSTRSSAASRNSERPSCRRTCARRARELRMTWLLGVRAIAFDFSALSRASQAGVPCLRRTEGFLSLQEGKDAPRTMDGTNYPDNCTAFFTGAWRSSSFRTIPAGLLMVQTGLDPGTCRTPLIFTRTRRPPSPPRPSPGLF